MVTGTWRLVAMEPGLGGQEKDAPRAALSIQDVVAMEPGLGGQEKLPYMPPPMEYDIVAMEPGLGGQEKRGRSHRHRRCSCTSQWSLALAARKSSI